jgi:hypothetical protein
MYTTKFLYLEQNPEIVIICVFPNVLITSPDCLGLSSHVGTGGFSCSCNLARLLVTGGAIVVVASSLLERGEFGSS